jgi:hypothetical protein
MARLRIIRVHGNGEYYGVQFHCPGCDFSHIVQTDWVPPGMVRDRGCRPDVWAFNGDLDHPVFSPSFLLQTVRHDPPVTPENFEEWKREPWPQERVPYVCHSFVGCNGAKPGQIVFLSDCTHDKRGMIVDLPDLGEDEEDCEDARA